MSGLLLPIFVFLLVGGVASAWLLGVRLRREQQAAAIRAMADLHWREFQRLVVEAMQRRGFRQTDDSDSTEADGLIELEHAGKPWLLSTKHGTAYVLGPAAISEFASHLQLHGATGGWMTTLGDVAADTRSLAHLQKIELLDGRTLWAEIAPLLEPAQRDAIMGTARARGNRHLLLAWLIAALAGALVFLLSGRADPTPEETAAPPPQAPAPAAASPRIAAAPAPAADSAAPAPEDPEALAVRRRKVADAVATLPWVDRAIWSTQSTLVVHLSGEPDRDALCGLLERYVELRASRLQLQPPRDSERPVRFIQCRTY